MLQAEFENADIKIVIASPVSEYVHTRYMHVLIQKYECSLKCQKKLLVNNKHLNHNRDLSLDTSTPPLPLHDGPLYIILVLQGMVMNKEKCPRFCVLY